MKIGAAPCMGCEERYFGCHGKCEKYQEFRKEKDKQCEERIKRSEIAYIANKERVRMRKKKVRDR